MKELLTSISKHVMDTVFLINVQSKWISFLEAGGEILVHLTQIYKNYKKVIK